MAVRDRYGRGVAVVWDVFGADGKLAIRFVTPAGTETYYGRYRMLSATRVESVVTDYDPKQICTLVCSPVRPVMPLGKAGISTVRFVGPNVMYLGTDRYNRQR